MSCDATVVVLTKPPEPGRVKTRLISALGEQGATALHLAMVTQTLSVVRDSGLDALIALDAPRDHPFAKTLREQGWTVVEQCPGDLGARLSHALAGPGRRIALGTDAPTIEPGWLKLAATRNEPVVIGPALDGGYWTVGVEGDCSALFVDIPWSTPRVLESTEHRARSAGLDVYRLPPCYDVDTPPDLRRLAADPRCPANLLAHLEAPCPP